MALIASVVQMAFILMAFMVLEALRVVMAFMVLMVLVEFSHAYSEEDGALELCAKDQFFPLFQKREKKLIARNLEKEKPYILYS